MADGDDITWHNESMPSYPDGMPLWQRILCLLGYHKRETRKTRPEHKGHFQGKPLDLGNMKLRDQCGRCGTLLLLFLAPILLAGCIGEQRNRQAVSFDGSAGLPWATNPEAPPAPLAIPTGRRADGGDGGSWRTNNPNTVATPADLAQVRSELAASQNATQQSLTGLGIQFGKAAERIEGVHAELSARLDNTVTATATASAQLRAELSATVNQQASINAKATADLRAEFDAKLQAIAAANAQLAGQVAAGIGNKTESTQSTSTAGRDSTQISFTPAMADMFAHMMDKFCEMTRAEMHTLAYIVTGIASTFAGVMTTLAGVVVHKVGKRHNQVIDHLIGTPADGKTPTVRVPAIKGAA